jgi:3-dehydroquinate dehydratase-2
MKAVLVLNGPNLNLLGRREPQVYGRISLDEINEKLVKAGIELGIEVRAFQSNHEGALIDALQEASVWAAGIIFNPGGYTHTSIALRDAIASISPPVIEVHISNVYGREEFRYHSMISGVCRGKIVGFGWRSYWLALQAIKVMIEDD